MIAAAAVCPHPPLLFRELAGREDAAEAVREACHAAVASVIAARPDVVVVVGDAVSTSSSEPDLGPGVRGFGTTAPRAAGPVLPLSLGVARRLLDDVGWTGRVELHGIAETASPAAVDELAGRIAGRDERVGLLVLGEGSARRGDKAPGYLDRRAFGFDAGTEQALAVGDPRALRDVDAALAAELLASGRAPFAVLGSAVHAEGWAPQAELGYADDPFGVMYFVATWKLAP